MIEPQQLKIFEENLKNSLVKTQENAFIHKSRNKKEDLLIDFGQYPMIPWMKPKDTEKFRGLYFIAPQNKDDLLVVKNADCTTQFYLPL